MLTLMPIAVVPCLVGGYWLPKLLVRKELMIEWNDDKHGQGTAVMLKDGNRCGASTTDRNEDGEIKIISNDDGSESGFINTDDVLAVEAGAWRCACQCSRGKVGVKQTAVDSNGGGTKTRGSYWTKASRAGQSYYCRWQGPGLKVKESTLVLPKEAVLRTEEQVELAAFEEGFAEAERMDALRTTLAPAHLNLESPWTKAVHGGHVYYWSADKGDPSGATLLMPEGLKALQMQDAEEDFELGFARATRLDELRSADKLNLDSPWMQAVDEEGVFYWRAGEIVGSLPEEGVKGDFGQRHREDLPVEWDDEKHSKGTAVMLKSDKRRGVSTKDRDDNGEIRVRFDDDGSEKGWIKTDDVWAVDAKPPEEGVKGDSGRVRREEAAEAAQREAKEQEEARKREQALAEEEADLRRQAELEEADLRRQAELEEEQEEQRWRAEDEARRKRREEVRPQRRLENACEAQTEGRCPARRRGVWRSGSTWTAD
eukprot:COSAG04_NODE_234_length_19155_cov_812.438707_7_plen_484_part_00